MHRLALDDLDWATDLLTAAFLQQPPADTLFQGARHADLTRYFGENGVRFTSEVQVVAEKNRGQSRLFQYGTQRGVSRNAALGYLASEEKRGQVHFLEGA